VGDTDVNVGTGFDELVMVNVSAVEVPPPGVGENTVTEAVPAGRFLAGKLPGLGVVTKGGGCGSPEIFKVAAEYFRKGSARSCVG
jgi:hypothetical protein